MNRIIRPILLVILLKIASSCTYTVTNNVKLKNFPPVKDVSDLDVYRYAYNDDDIEKRDAKKYGFKPLIWRDIEKYKYPTPTQIESQKQSLLPKSGCVLDVKYGGKGSIVDNPKFGITYNMISGLTLFLIPYYSPSTQTLDATLIDAKTQTVLKKYHFQENVAYWINSNPIFWIFYVGKEGSSEASIAYSDLHQRLEEALVRSATNDVHILPECQKQPQSKPNSAAKK